MVEYDYSHIACEHFPESPNVLAVACEDSVGKIACRAVNAGSVARAVGAVIYAACKLHASPENSAALKQHRVAAFKGGVVYLCSRGGSPRGLRAFTVV